MKMDAEVLFSHPFHFCRKYGNMDGVNSFHFKHINLNTAKCFRVFSTSLNFSNQKASMLLAAQKARIPAMSPAMVLSSMAMTLKSSSE